MPEFEIKCEYCQIEKRKFFKGEKEKNYHRFLVKNSASIPEQYCDKWKGKFEENQVNSWIFVADELLKELGISNFIKEKKQYRFIIEWGREKSAKFMKKNPNSPDNNYLWHNNMVLKTKEYFQNTVQKIGFWEGENYFYEANKKQIPKQNQSNQGQSNKDTWIKITLICLPVLVVSLLLLGLTKWISRKKIN